MDFHRLARRELQTLCKKNKIPANMTNVAMADALKALEIVEGIEEFLHPCQSETAQSSVESPVRSEVTSPYVPPTGGRSTRRRNVLKEEPETAKPMTRSRCTTRRTVVKDSDASQDDATETPAVVARTNRKKASMASACRKMDSQLKECVEEEKKDATMTPAPLGVTSRRRAAKEASAVKRAYSTRRSVRLAEKNAGLLKEVENENSGLLKKDLFTKDHENVEMNLTGNSDDLDGVSGISGGDANTNGEETSEKKDEVEVVSAQKQDVSLVGEGEMVGTGEDEIGNHFEAHSSKPEAREGSDVEIQEVGFGCGTVAEFDEQTSDKSEDPKDENVVMPLNVHDEVQESDGSHDVHTSEIEITVENKEELDTHKDAEEYEFKAAEQKEGMEVVSPQKQDISIVSEGKMVSTGEEETGNDFEADSSKPEAKEGNDVDIQQVRFCFETNAELDGQKCYITEDPKIENIVMPKSNEVEESNGSHDDLHAPEIGITVENKAELNTYKDADEGKAADLSKPQVKEGNDVEIQEVGFGFETDAELDEQKYDITEDPTIENIVMPNSSEVEESNGSHDDLHAPGIGITVENKAELNTYKDADEGKAADLSKPQVKEGNDVEIQEVGFGFETDAELDEQKYDITEDPKIENIVMPKSNEVEESYGSHDDLHAPEIEITVENKAELNTCKDADEGKAADLSKPQVKEGNDVEIQELGFGFETNAELDEQKCDNTEDPKIENIVMPKSNEVEESNGSHDDLHTPEIGITVENKEELNTDKGAEYEGKAAECTETIVLEVEEASCDTDIPNEIDKEFYNDKGMDSNLNEEVSGIKEAMPNTLLLTDAASSEIEADVSEMEFNTEESADFVTSEAKKESADAINSLAQMPSDISLPSEEDEVKMELHWNAVIAELTENNDPNAEKNDINLVKNTEGPHEIGIIQHEESTKSADKVISESKEESTDAIYQNTDDSDITLVNDEDGAKMKLNIINWNAFIADLSVNQDPVAEKNEIILAKDMEELHEVEIIQHEESTEPAHQVPSDTSGCLQEQDLRPIAKPMILTPIKSSVSKATVTKKRMPTAVSDNKENIGSGSKLVLATERVKTAENVQNLDHLSVRKLSKMLKEKLTITNKESKNENENEQALVRPALQALLENR